MVDVRERKFSRYLFYLVDGLVCRFNCCFCTLCIFDFWNWWSLTYWGFLGYFIPLDDALFHDLHCLILCIYVQLFLHMRFSFLSFSWYLFACRSSGVTFASVSQGVVFSSLCFTLSWMACNSTLVSRSLLTMSRRTFASLLAFKLSLLVGLLARQMSKVR